MTTDEPNRLIAEALTAAGHANLAWTNVLRCSNPSHRSLRATGRLCTTCLLDGYAEQTSLSEAWDAVRADIEAHDADPAWHPEWRGQRQAYRFDQSLDRIVDALDAFRLNWTRKDTVNDQYLVIVWPNDDRQPGWAIPRSTQAGDIAAALVAATAQLLESGTERS